jgi:hypothetical protein
MHDWDLKANECPWAVSAFQLGGKRAGSWWHPCIGDWVWITFEKQHPYGPVWIGFADPTRRKLYCYPSIYTRTPLPVDSNGNPAQQPDDYQQDFLPKDYRPMSVGYQDRYGSLDMSCAVGFFPIEHKVPPSDPDNDPIQALNKSGAGATNKTPYKAQSQQPEVNSPDQKYMVRLSKYGHVSLLGDQGYYWRKKGAQGEFAGDFETDEKWEVQRWRYLQQLLNEGSTTSDQRRIMLLTRYGHKFEMRDVGWKKTREGEYGDQREISTASNDQRWMKFRSKGGMLMQMSDIGFDAEHDEFVKRKLIDETGDKADGEEAWKGKDARWMRFVTRYGFKIALDDRGSDTKDAEGKENPRGYGILIKGRRTPGAQGTQVSGDPRGYYWEFNEKDEYNQTTWGTPLGLTVQLNDKLQYAMIATRRGYSMPWQKLKDNEFLTSPLAANNLEQDSYHLKLDHHNEYLSLKTRGGSGAPPSGATVDVPARKGTQQGLECRDGSNSDEPWVELVDIDERGIWFWGKKGMTICRAKQSPNAVKICWWFDETRKEIVIRNDEKDGRIQVACDGDMEIISNSQINIRAAGSISLISDERVVLGAGSTRFEVAPNIVQSTQYVHGPNPMLFQPIGVQAVKRVKLARIPQLTPNIRGQRFNKDLEGV